MLPDDSVFMLHSTDEDIYGTKWDNSENIIFANRYLDINIKRIYLQSSRVSNLFVADKLDNIFYA